MSPVMTAGGTLFASSTTDKPKPPGRKGVVNERSNLVLVLCLSGLAGVALLGTVVLEACGRQIPPVLPTIAAACIGGVTGFLQQRPVNAEAIRHEFRQALRDFVAAGGSFSPPPVAVAQPPVTRQP